MFRHRGGWRRTSRRTVEAVLTKAAEGVEAVHDKTAEGDEAIIDKKCCFVFASTLNNILK